ncbi:hypothetical protein B0F90DRAFT_1691802 [Multifurca ochricompacta]|uniref:Trafficking protein particle complex subunit 10 n=1 Tax=Multifurca ochricompacta TaxID=376703 RepID=A0AAD4MAL7_9AGAM|nr:hypothetical protein B0F90DRAFT_1691802 [Multifurca ochricompacta]
MSTQRVLVTYSAPQSFISSDQWKQLYDALLGQLPLRNIHWKPQTRPSIRTIQELELQLVALDTIRDENTSQVPCSLLERPLLNIYVVICEDSDAYKATARKQIKDWQASLSHRKNQEWIIVHVVRSDARNVSTNFFQMKGNVLDKIKAEFNTDKRDRCVQLAWPLAQDNPAAWAELLSKVKDGLLSAFDTAVSQRDDEVRRSEGQQSMPGWNFCTFFILKESLAASFEGMNLFEDALRYYDELEMSFAHVLREKNLSWFGTLIIPGAKDDSLPLLSITKKPYRDLIVANTVSVFDLRIYILAKQCGLLGKIGKVADVCRKVAMFLTSFGRHLREVSVILPPYFIESWTYSSALSAIEQADFWARNVKLEGIVLNQFNACKAELLELARNQVWLLPCSGHMVADRIQLDLFGIQLGLLPSRPPFSMSSPGVPALPVDAKRESRIISNSELLKCSADQTAFYDLYTKLTNRAIDTYVKAGRRKFALRLHGSLAALDVRQDRMTSALQTYSSLPAHYAPHGWTSLESYMLSQAINVYALSGTDKDKQWINIALAYLKLCSGATSSESLTHQENSTTYITEVVDSLKVAVDKLNEPFSYPEHPALSIRLLDEIVVPAEDEDGYFLFVSVLNLLSCPLPASKICVSLSGRESEQLRFCTQVKLIEPGTSTFKLFCPSSSWGTYILDQTEVTMSNLHLKWNHRPATMKSVQASRTKRFVPTLVRILKDVRAFGVCLRQPRSVEFGPGMSSRLFWPFLLLTGPPGVTFRFQESTVDGDATSASLECATDSISIADLAEDSQISVLIPHSDASAYDTMQITMLATYNTRKDAAVNRSLLQSSRVPASLPIAVNVQDFFRGERLFSRFTISASAQNYICVSSATLESVQGDKGGLSIFDTLVQMREIVVQIEAYLEQNVEALDDYPQHDPDRSRLIAQTIRALESDSDWVAHRGITDELRVPTLDKEGAQNKILTLIGEMLTKGKLAGAKSGSWREIRIQVDVPILAAVRLRLIPTLFSANSESSDQMPPLYAGQPIPALLSIKTSFHWGKRQHASRKSYQMRFDIQEMVRDWLISGRKRGDFEAEDESTYTVAITLIALHHGELSLPKVVAHQVHGAEKVLILPRGGRSTFIVGMGEGLSVE